MIDFVIDDPDYNASVIESIRKLISEDGYKPEAAAFECGISIRKFQRWMTNPDFKTWVNLLIQKHCSEQRKRITDELEIIDDPKARVDKRIQYLSHIDPEFTRSSKVEISEKTDDDVGKMLEDMESDEDYQKVIKKAEEAIKGDEGEDV